ncbi:MAG: hypothetical protein WDZ88_03830 [Candidatus Paceibacterota bacterium]
MALDINRITEQYNFSENEKKIMSDSGTANTAAMNQSRIVSEFILAKKIDIATDRMIESNKKLSESNEKYSKAMLYLTGALVFVGIVQIFF